jgi:hypothetical protein
VRGVKGTNEGGGRRTALAGVVATGDQLHKRSNCSGDTPGVHVAQGTHTGRVCARAATARRRSCRPTAWFVHGHASTHLPPLGASGALAWLARHCDNAEERAAEACLPGAGRPASGGGAVAKASPPLRVTTQECRGWAVRGARLLLAVPWTRPPCGAYLCTRLARHQLLARASAARSTKYRPSCMSLNTP